MAVHMRSTPTRAVTDYRNFNLIIYNLEIRNKKIE